MFQTPEVVMVYSDSGLNGMSQTYHELYRSRLARGPWRDRARPILINNWEATYFDFDEEKILKLARTAKDVGVELFVLDDGWFGRRDDSRSSLGDWYPYRKKLPEGVAGIARRIEEMGLAFGLWIEPEMVNKDSDLYRAHPDWMLSAPGRSACHGRNQFVLDFFQGGSGGVYLPDVKTCAGRGACLLYQMGYEPVHVRGIFPSRPSGGTGDGIPPLYSGGIQFV